MSKELDKSNTEERLIKLGLSLKEAQVYMSLLTLGEVGASKIVRDTGLHGQFVYQSLDKLEKRGLVQYVLMRGRKKFSAKSPSSLLRLAEEQKRTAEDVIADITSSFALSEEQDFQVFKGKEAFIIDQLETLERTPKNSIIKVIGGDNDKWVLDMGKRFEDYEYARKKKNIEVWYLVSKSGAANVEPQHIDRHLFKTRVLDGKFTGEVNTAIYPEYLTFAISADTVYSIRMKSTKVANGYGQFFDTLWKLAK